MTIGPKQLADYVKDVADRARTEEQRLNAADAELGDGDTGSMLVRVTNAMAHSPAEEADTLANAAQQLAMAAMRETGSSLGTLVATAAMTLAKEAKRHDEEGAPLKQGDLPALIATIRDAMAARGKAERGDKTILDSLDALSEGMSSTDCSRQAAKKAARDALDAFRDRPCKIGRARMFPEKSKGLDDPGMLAVAILV